MPAVEDGPNDEAMYRSSSLKIMHLLKQPTKSDEPSKDRPSLPALVQKKVSEGKLGKSFLYRLALRSYGLLNSFASWQKAEGCGPHTLGEALLASAIVNLENLQVKRETADAEVLEWAERNKDRWHGQIVTWKPHVIVCGGTFNAVWKALGKTQLPAGVHGDVLFF